MTVTVIKRTCLDNVRYLSVKLFFSVTASMCHSSLVTQEGGGGSARGDRYVQAWWAPEYLPGNKESKAVALPSPASPDLPLSSPPPVSNEHFLFGPYFFGT